MIIEGSGSESGSIPLTSGSGSGSGRPKNTWIRWIRIRIRFRIRNTGHENIYLYFHLLISVCPKTMEMKIFDTTFPPYEDLKILGMLFTSHITPHTTTLGNE
jgi:hypothetical protein